MPIPDKTAPATATDEDRIAAALVGRGLVTAEEIHQCRGEPSGGKELLARLAKAGFLSVSQAKRFALEVPQLIQQQIPGYQIIEKLGQGAMGTVYKAKQLSMDRMVAIKILQPKMAANKEFLDRFRREARTAAKFSSNNVVQAIDVGSAGNLQYFIMEYVPGKTVREDIDGGKVFGEREAIDIVLQIAQALQHAHRRGLVHRDIKPGNIIITAEGVAKLADLGLARHRADRATITAEKGLVFGTPFYISPEQIEGREDIDIRADIYSLGATLYHMVTGQPPFHAEKLDEVLDAHLTKDLTPPDHLNTSLSTGLGEVVEFMMAKEPGDRYRTPEELMIDLECLLNGEPPRLARQHFQAALLKGLAEGEDEQDDDEADEPPRGIAIVWVAILAGALAVSIILNLGLLVSLMRGN
jgi:eukaryotic-like serine/threonine-protein kinase